MFPGQGTINRPHMLQPKIPQAETKAPGSQKKKLLPVAGSGEGVASTMWDLKGGKKQAKEMGRGR